MAVHCIFFWRFASKERVLVYVPPKTTGSEILRDELITLGSWETIKKSVSRIMRTWLHVRVQQEKKVQKDLFPIQIKFQSGVTMFKEGETAKGFAMCQVTVTIFYYCLECSALFLMYVHFLSFSFRRLFKMVDVCLVQTIQKHLK